MPTYNWVIRVILSYISIASWIFCKCTAACIFYVLKKVSFKELKFSVLKFKLWWVFSFGGLFFGPISEIFASANVTKIFLLCYLLEVLLHGMNGQGSYFFIWISNCSSTICWKDYHSPLNYLKINLHCMSKSSFRSSYSISLIISHSFSTIQSSLD